MVHKGYSTKSREVPLLDNVWDDTYDLEPNPYSQIMMQEGYYTLRPSQDGTMELSYPI